MWERAEQPLLWIICFFLPFSFPLDHHKTQQNKYFSMKKITASAPFSASFSAASNLAGQRTLDAMLQQEKAASMQAEIKMILQAVQEQIGRVEEKVGNVEGKVENAEEKVENIQQLMIKIRKV
uniref:t-SNARE coiled-coil homology domain-containing protein n=1 Tax=Micrurus carvalhoi TaxID=3147026 RepID=A0A2H6N8B8_9SAUR